jgi:hypothetical protein
METEAVKGRLHELKNDNGALDNLKSIINDNEVLDDKCITKTLCPFLDSYDLACNALDAVRSLRERVLKIGVDAASKRWETFRQLSRIVASTRDSEALNCA